MNDRSTELPPPGSSPSLSVILCVNRSNPHLAAAIDSILSQTWANFEFLIGANGCGDDLIVELEALSRGDRRVRVVRSDLPQLSFMLNRLADQARSEWLVRMDADDVSEPNRLERLRQAMTEGGPNIIGSWALLIDDKDREIGRFEPPTTTQAIRRRMLVANPICHPTVAIRRAAWLRLRGYLGGYVSEDFDLWLRALQSGERIENVPETLLRYRIHGAQASRSRLGYAETAAHWYRSLLAHPSLYHLTGWLVATAKLATSPLLSWRRTRRSL